MSPKSPPLPDLDDEEFTARLKPLEAVMVPRSGSTLRQEERNPGYSDVRIVANPQTKAQRQVNSNPGTPDLPDRCSDSPETQDSEAPSNRIVEIPNDRTTERPVFRNSGSPHSRKHRIVDAAERLAQIEQRRGPKRRFEFLIPTRVGDALAEDAARRGKSATIRFLEILRDAGYPVIPEDLMDLRKERRR